MKFQDLRLPSCNVLSCAVLACAFTVPSGLAFAQSAPTPPLSTWIDPVSAPAEAMPLAAQSLLLDVTRSGDHYIAVGARGNVLVSEDGRTWHQSSVPTRTTLTAITAIDAHIWAVGHDGLIAHSADSGSHWELQRQDPWKGSTTGSDAAHDLHQGAPLLGVLFTDIHRGYAVGAYSLALKTIDGGATWQTLIVAKPKPDAETAGDDTTSTKSGRGAKQTFSADELKLGQEATPHFNAIARTGNGALFIVGERGSAFRSRDDGATWQRLQLPYEGSMFGVIGYEADHVLTFGLRGHVYESTDLGEHWTQVQTGTELSLMGGTALPGGGGAIVGANGIVLVRANAGEALKSYVDEPAGIIAAVVPFADHGTLLIAGENGVSLFQPQ